MIEPSELDIAQLKFEMRQMHKEIGFDGCLQVLFEMLKGAEILSEVMIEEKYKESHNG